ncbi:MAG TPA: hypothetical protein VG518_04645 [Solirubrobacterales bacterium]|nr:hypothetical protein [Solirubrobacterales bacterium]
MTATINTRACLRGVMAIAALVAALLIPAHASASSNCSNANSDPTAAQYCSPVEGTHTGHECTEAGSGSGGSGTSAGTERCGTNEVEAASAESGSSESTSSGSLPFTGFDAVALLAAALALAAAGFALRRLSSTEH